VIVENTIYTKVIDSPNNKPLEEIFQIDFFREGFLALIPLIKE
jgi:hypothetical protein